MSNKWNEGSIDGVIIKKLTRYLDQRGCLCETFRLDELPPDLKPVMSYVTYTEPGVTRGPHEHIEQTDIFAFLGPGNFKIRLWDNRETSSTYGNYMDLFAGKDNNLTIIIPPGVVHCYKNISKMERGMVLNFPNLLYKGWEKQEEVDEIRYEDQKENPFLMN